MLSDQHNLTMVNAIGLIFSLFDTTLVLEVPFGMPPYVQCILHGLTSALLCVPFGDVDLVVVCDGFLFIMENFPYWLL